MNFLKEKNIKNTALCIVTISAYSALSVIVY